MAVSSRKISPGAKPKVSRAKKVAVVPAEIEYVSPFAVGNRVIHASFGNGEVAEVSKNQLSIRFDDVGAKVILDSFVTRQKS
jgi:transcription elongation factor GreA-like protein